MDEKSIPRMRSNAHDVNWLLSMFAIAQMLENGREELRPRFEVIPQGMKRMRWAHSVISKLVDQLLLTYPPEKYQTIYNQSKHLYFKLDVMPGATRNDHTKTIMEVDDLEVLIASAHEKCLLCPNPEKCGKCELGRTLDRCTPEDRGKTGSWATMIV